METTIGKIEFACSKDEKHPAMCGVLFDGKNKRLACDIWDAIYECKKLIREQEGN